MSFCTKCGTGLPLDARFCPKCGTAAAVSAAPPVPPAPPPPRASENTLPGRTVAPAAASSPVHEVARAAANPPPVPPPAASRAPQAGPKRGGRWWIGPAAVVGLVILGAIVLTFLPLDRDEPKPEPEATETIAEGETPAQQPPQSGTLVEVGGPEDEDGDSTGTVNTTTIAPPPLVATAPPATASVPPASAGVPPPATRPASGAMPRTPAPSGPVADNRPPQRPPAAAPPRPPATAPSRPISSTDAASRLRGYVTSTRYYGVANECVRVESRGYRNVGYNMEVWHACPGSGGSSRLLGRWRVDAKTGEVFRRRDDGRYLKP